MNIIIEGTKIYNLKSIIINYYYLIFSLHNFLFLFDISYVKNNKIFV